MFGQTKPGSTDIGIKKANQYEMVTRDEYIRRAKLMHKSRKDIVWWAENFFHIITMDKGLTKIKLYEKQKELLQFMCDNTRIASLASRQTGKTTTYTVYALWLATLFSDKKILICANKLATAMEIMDRIRKAALLLPKEISPGVVAYNKGDITFDNGSSIRAYSTSSSGARGASGNCVHENTKVQIRLFGWLKLKVSMKTLKHIVNIVNKIKG